MLGCCRVLHCAVLRFACWTVWRPAATFVRSAATLQRANWSAQTVTLAVLYHTTHRTPLTSGAPVATACCGTTVVFELLSAGSVLSAAEVGLLASQGITQVSVHRRPVVGSDLLSALNVAEMRPS